MAPQKDKDDERGQRSDAVARMFDALASKDEEAYREVLDSNPELKTEFSGLDNAYQKIRDTLKNESLGPEYDEIGKRIERWTRQRCEASGPGTLTDAVQGRPREEVQALIESLAMSIVVVILEDQEKIVAPKELDRIAAKLCSGPVQDRLLAADHVRDEFVLVVAEELDDLTVVEGITRERLTDLVQKHRKQNNLEAFEDLTIHGIR